MHDILPQKSPLGHPKNLFAICATQYQCVIASKYLRAYKAPKQSQLHHSLFLVQYSIFISRHCEHYLPCVIARPAPQAEAISTLNRKSKIVNRNPSNSKLSTKNSKLLKVILSAAPTSPPVILSAAQRSRRIWPPHIIHAET